MSEIKLVLSDIVTAYTDRAIGSKVIHQVLFHKLVCKALEGFDFAACRQPGQAYIELDRTANLFVVSGVGRPTMSPDDYVIRVHRDRVGLYLKRSKAAPVQNTAVVVYTREAYLADPEIDWNEVERIDKEGATHVLVAVLASAGEGAPLTPNRLIQNLAGGNNEALAWTADEIRQKAAEVAGYSDKWHVVAD
jgi:hypothetical protein